MNKRERVILMKCARALQSIPGQGNSMSIKGLSDYGRDIKLAISKNFMVISFLMDAEYEEAEALANELEEFAKRCVETTT